MAISARDEITSFIEARNKPEEQISAGIQEYLHTPKTRRPGCASAICRPCLPRSGTGVPASRVPAGVNA
jgi:hypothetical protein